MESAERGWRGPHLAECGGNSEGNSGESEVAERGAWGAHWGSAAAGNSAVDAEVDRCAGVGAADWGGASGGIVSSGGVGEEYSARSTGKENGRGGVSVFHRYR